MKRMFFLVLFVSTLFVSCSEDTLSVKDELDASQLKSATAMRTVEEERLIFSMLDNNEKYLLWKDKLESILVTETLNSTQDGLIREMLTKIKVEAWDKSDDYHAYFTNVYLKDFLIRADQNFEDIQIVNYFFRSSSLHLLTHAGNDGGGGGGGATSGDCECLKNEFTGWDCGVLNNRWCRASTCKTVDGCGALNTSFCDGRCS